MNRTERDLICIVCPNGCRIHSVTDEKGNIETTGNKCARGEAFVRTELTAPMRTVTTTIHTEIAGMPFLPVRTDGEIPKSAVPAALEQLSEVTIKEKVCCGDIILRDLAGCGVAVIATADAGQEEE